MVIKRLFDIFFSLIGLTVLLIPITVFYFLAVADTRQNGFFLQSRIGQYGRVFKIIKLRSMQDTPAGKKISSFGRFIRNYKIDEFPQLINVLKGDMSLVGPRPDVPGYYDRLEGAGREVLKLKPGITGPASLKYANEEQLLAKQGNPLKYNDEVIFPDKVRINLNYLQHYSLLLDIKILLYTFMRKKMEEKHFN